MPAKPETRQRLWRDFYHRCVAEGKCPGGCSDVPAEGRIYCAGCLEVRSAKDRQRREERKGAPLRHYNALGGDPLGRAVRAKRRASGLTMEQCAPLVGLSLSGLYALEMGRVKRPRRGTVERVRGWLGEVGTPNTTVHFTDLGADHATGGRG